MADLTGVQVLVGGRGSGIGGQEKRVRTLLFVE